MNLSDPTLPVPSMEALRNLFGIAKQMATPPDPYQEAGRMVQQARQGDYLGALETGIGAMPNTGAIKAYHGSPHSFDRFDLSKIGTGEGAQAYGHGLYFADNEAVAKAYRDALVKTVPTTSEDGWIAHVVSKAGGNRDEAARIAKMYSREAVTDEASDQWARVAQRIASPDAERLPSGHMYEVNINAEPEHFLDWDKPLSKQRAIEDALTRQMNASLARGDKAGYDKVDALLNNIDWDKTDGATLLQQLQRDMGERQASEYLSGSGIPGIKYLDQGSRGAGEGSRNYVVFDDKLVDIMRKYGFVPFGAGVGMEYGAQDNRK